MISNECPPAALRSAPSAWVSRGFWAILALSTAVKLALAIGLDSRPPVLDELAYLRLAQTLVNEGRFDTTFRPPLYPALIAFWLWSGVGVLGVRLTQVVLSALSVWLTFRLAQRAAPDTPGAALLAAALVAFHPTLVMFSHRLWSETTFIFLLLAALDLLMGALNRRAVWLTAGLLLGAAALTRPVILPFLPLLGAWALIQLRRTGVERPWLKAAGRLALLGVGVTCVVAPWTIRNFRQTGDFVLVTTNSAFNLLVGSQPEAAFVVKDDTWRQEYGAVDGTMFQDLERVDPGGTQQEAIELALENIQEDPKLFVRKSIWEAGRLWTLDSFLLRHLRNGWYGGPTPRWVLVSLTLLTLVYMLVLYIGGVLGLATERPSRLRGVVLLLIGFSVALFGLAYSLSRYALPLHPLLAVFAAEFLCRPALRLRGVWGSPAGWRRLACAAIALAGLLFVWFNEAELFRDMLTTGGARHVFRLGTFAS